MPSSSVSRRIFLLASSSASSASLSHAHPRTHNRSSHRRTPDLSPSRPCSLLMLAAAEVVVLVVVVVAIVMVVVEESVPPYPPKHKHRDRARIHVRSLVSFRRADNLFLSFSFFLFLSATPVPSERDTARRERGAKGRNSGLCLRGHPGVCNLMSERAEFPGDRNKCCGRVIPPNGG